MGWGCPRRKKPRTATPRIQLLEAWRPLSYALLQRSEIPGLVEVLAQPVRGDRFEPPGDTSSLAAGHDLVRLCLVVAGRYAGLDDVERIVGRAVRLDVLDALEQLAMGTGGRETNV